jgi:trans-aconitate 2-methyltransferase
MMTDIWNAKTYSQFLDLRTRPARDLLMAIPSSFQPGTVYDLGCGPGNSTGILKQRWPHAHIIGLDSSVDMLKEARSSYPDLTFIQGDIAHFSPEKKVDCLFANASLHWLDEHDVLLSRLIQHLSPGGVIAIQMPNNFHSPSHQVTVDILSSRDDWRPLLRKLRYGSLSEPSYRATWYYDVLTKAGVQSIQIWETEYFQEMPDYQSLFDWVKGTGLRPVLATMDLANQEQLAQAYVQAIAKKYPRQANNKILLPFRRLFMIGNAVERRMI